MDGVLADEPAPQIPLRWMAPESLHRPMKFSTKSDVWSFAVMLYEIFNQGEKPWKDVPAKKIATLIRRCHMPCFPEGTPKEISNLASRIWVLDPQQRPSMKDVNHSLLTILRIFGPPPPESFTVNKLEGVCRTNIACYYSVEDTAEDDSDGDADMTCDDSSSARKSSSRSKRALR
ncbi:Protein kinase domain-containing protein [Trichostrongylus colubriformis]|uniref:Protein kinase domain-containing protein n=1 Tax=Trichostrongylus colubriformis TaxID=6319 RepID=A0AAN8J0A0_TRICO